jgi:hypothetical protein
VISANTTRLLVVLFVLSFGALLLNSIGVPFPPGPDLYYAGLLGTLLVGFLLFADVAIAES